jgi:carbamoyltransferase
VQKETGEDYLCLAGGVALNCVANGHVLRDKAFKGIWVQPAAGDAGGALGAAAIGWHVYEDRPRTAGNGDGMRGTYLGPRYAPGAIEAALRDANAVYRRLGDDELCTTVADLLAAGNVVGWFQGRMEFGPRALGARSILGDARNPAMQSVMNLKIKYRESFRPVAPSVLAERVADYFEQDVPSPYMSLVAPLRESRRLPVSDEERALFGIDKLKARRSQLPAITHVDYSARIQTVHVETNPRYHRLLAAFERKTGCAVIVNTSFNVRGEPIVCTPEDAYRCFMRTEIDYLVIEDFLIDKREQPKRETDDAWRTTLDLD